MDDTVTRFTVLCITIISIACATAGTFLLLKGYQGGELFAGSAGAGLTGLLGFIGGKMNNQNRPTQQNVATSQTITAPETTPQPPAPPATNPIV